MKIPTGYTIWEVNTSLNVGKWISVYIATLTTVLSIISIATGYSYSGINGSALLDAFVVGLFAYKMHVGRRWAYVCMFILYIFEVYWRVSEGLDVAWLWTIGFIVCLGNAVIASYTAKIVNELDQNVEVHDV